MEPDPWLRAWRYFLEGMRVTVVAGIATGIVVVGLGSRLAMLVLRVTSPDHVVGLESDDGFEIGRVTLAGTYNLVLLGAAVGIIGAVAYRLVRPHLLGPTWFRRLTVAVASGIVAGSMLVHADGIDFHALQPTWLAIGLFVALPALFGLAIGSVVDRVARPDSWTAAGYRRWLLPVIVVACVPLVLFVLVLPVLVIGIGAVAREVAGVERVRRSAGYAVAVSAVWLLIAVAGLVALTGDVRALY